MLREYADALEKSEQAAKSAEGIAEVAWIRNASDWLDPLISKIEKDVEEDN